MQDNSAPRLPENAGHSPFRMPGAWTIRSIMLAPALKAARGAFDPAYRPVNLRDPLEVEKARQAYSALETTSTSLHPDIPKTIWMLWQQGWDKAPDLAKACAKSWQEQNPGWDVRLLDEESLPRHIAGYSEIVRTDMTRQNRSDLARTLLLHQHGGVWADASLFCVRPLDGWLPQVAGAGFFVFTDPRPYRAIENWFIAGAKGNYFIATMLELFKAYWGRFRKEHRYYWMMYLMEYLAKADPEARRIWDAMGKRSALGPLAVAVHAFSEDPPASVLRLIDERKVPVHKLSHRWRSDDLGGTVLERLTGLNELRGP